MILKTKDYIIFKTEKETYYKGMITQVFEELPVYGVVYDKGSIYVDEQNIVGIVK